MKPALAHHLVRLFSRPGEMVLDPFAGVGTIPFEAALQGRRAFGIDINPLAVYVTAAKLKVQTADSVQRVLQQLDSQVHGPAEDEVPDEISNFFHPDTLVELVALRRALLSGAVANSSIVMAAAAHVLHGNRPYALSRRSHGIIPIPPKGPFLYKPVIPAVREKLRRSRHWDVGSEFVAGQALLGSAFQLPLRDECVDCTITSPPFLGTTDFLRQNRVRLWFAGWDYSRQKAMKSEMSRFANGLAPYVRSVAEIARVTKPGGTVVVHLGTVKKKDVAGELAQLCDTSLTVIDILREDVGHLESHGRTDRGATGEHTYLVMRKRSE